MSINKGLFTSDYECWETPQSLFDELDREFHFTLDAAATPDNAKCARFYTPQDDALKQSWQTGGGVFCNPPYGRKISDFVKKAYTEFQNGVSPIVLLIPSRTDTQYFHNYIYGKAEIRFLRGRLYFTNPNGSNEGRAPFPSMIVIYRNGAR